MWKGVRVGGWSVVEGNDICVGNYVIVLVAVMICPRPVSVGSCIDDVGVKCPAIWINRAITV
jgi:hypothetical protein